MCDDLHGTETMEQYFQVEVVVLLVTLSAETKGFVHKFNSKNKLAQKSKQCYVKILLKSVGFNDYTREFQNSTLSYNTHSPRPTFAYGIYFLRWSFSVLKSRAFSDINKMSITQRISLTRRT